MSRRLRRGRVVAVLGVVAAIGLVFAGLAVSRSAAFSAETLRVRGASFRTDAQVLARAGLDGSTNVIHLDGDAATRALREDPWIADAWIETDLPSTIVVHVRERSPIAAADGQGIAADGTWLPGADLDGLPVLRAAIGFLDRAAAVDAAVALADLPGAWRREIEIALLLPDGTIRFTTDSGLSIDWGRPGSEPEKVTALRAILRWAEDSGEPLAMVDVSIPATPAARLMSGSTVSL